VFFVETGVDDKCHKSIDANSPNQHLPQTSLIAACTTTSVVSASATGLSVDDLGALVDGPARPVLHSFPKSLFGKQNRSFSTSLYSYDFIEYSIEKDAVFCFPCRHFTSSTDYKDSAFTEKGVGDWKKDKREA